MTNLRKCVGVSSFAVLALAFVCLIISQAVIAEYKEAVVNPNADNSFETDVPLPVFKGPSGMTSSNQPVEYSTFSDDDPPSAEISPYVTLRGKTQDGPMADGVSKAQGDNFGDPHVIGDETALPFTHTGDISSGTDEHTGSCEYGAFGGGIPDYFYQFSPTVNMTIDITMCNAAGGYDLGLMVYEDNGVDPITAIACSDDGCGDYEAGQVAALSVTGGNVYYFVVDGWEAGPYQIDVTEFVDPFADECATADFYPADACGDRTHIGCYGTGGVGDMWDLTSVTALDGYKICGELEQDMYNPPSSGGTRDSDWYLFEYTGTNPANLTVRCASETLWVTVLGILPGGVCPITTFWGWAVSPYAELVSDPATLFPGDVFSWYCRSHDAGPDCITDGEPQAKYYAEFSLQPLTPIDDCPLAREIAGDTEVGTPIVQDLCGFTTDGPGVGPYGGSPYMYFNNGWFLWTCEESGQYTFSACTSPNVLGSDGVTYESHDLFMAAFPAGCPAAEGSELAFSDDAPACPGYEPEITFIAAEGLSYLITVAAWDPYSGQDCGEVWLDISHVPIPLVADNCADEQIPITEDTYGEFFNNLNATLDGPDPTACNAVTFGGDVWFAMTAWETGTAYLAFCDVNYDANMEVYEGLTCPTNANYRDPIRCNDDGCPQLLTNWPEYHGSYTSFLVQAGETYLIRVGGWYLPPDYPLTLGGMGFGWYDAFIEPDPSTVSPANDYCTSVMPVLLADGVTDTRTGATDYWTRNDCEDFPPNHEDEVWEAFSVPIGVCMDVQCDFFGSVDRHNDGSRYGAEQGDGVVWTGCPCEGDFVSVTATLSCLHPNDCVLDYAPAGEFNNGHVFEMMPGGDYWFMLNWSAAGFLGHWFDYQLNITGAELECAYCMATSNYGTCELSGGSGIAGASWITEVHLADLDKLADPPDGDPNYQDNCSGYLDNSAMVANLYKGISYPLTFVMAKNGLPTNGNDTAAVWVDWNQNAVFFDAGENYGPSRSAYTWSTTITPPLDAYGPGEGATGETRMRIRLASLAADGTPTYCGEMTFGEVEDYTIAANDLECGDFDMDGDVDADDIAFLQAWYFGGGMAPDYWQRADIDGDGMITLADIIALVDAAYHGGDMYCMGM